MTLALFQVEFAVQIKSQECIKSVQEALQRAGVTDIEIDQQEGRVVIETATIPWNELQRTIEATGRRAVLTGFGGKSCVSIVDVTECSGLRGVVRFCAVGASGVVIDGVIDGLAPSVAHSVSVHECGDVSRGCESVGDFFGGQVRVTSDAEGRASFRVVEKELSVDDLIGRSVVVSQAGDRLGCGIIARSAGIFENYKKICACDGLTLWDERDRPIAGKGRSKY